MESYEKIKYFSEAIYRLLRKMQQKESLEKDPETYELYNSLLRDLYEREEDYLGNMDAKSFDDFVTYLKENFGFTFCQTVYELFVSKKYELPLLRIYQRVKEEYDRRRFSSLTVKEENALVGNEFVQVQRLASDSIRILDSHAHRLASRKNAFSFFYLFSSLSNPISSSFLSLKQEFSQDDEFFELDYRYSIETISTYLFSLIQAFLESSNLEYLEYFKCYMKLIPDYLYEEFVCSFELQYASVRETRNFSLKNLSALSSFFESIGLRSMNYQEQEIEQDDTSELVQFSYQDIRYFDSLFQEVISFSSAILQLFYQVYQSKLNHENREARLPIYLKLARLRQVEREFLDKVSDVLLFQEYVMICNTTNYVTVPFEILDCATSMFNDSQDTELVKRMSRDRAYSSIMLLTEKEKNKQNPAFPGGILLMDVPMSSIGNVLASMFDGGLFANPMKEEANPLAESFYMDSVLYYQDTEMYRYFKEHMNEENQKIYYLVQFLFLYRDASVLETLIQRDFELDYFKEKVKVNSEYLVKNGKLLYKMFEQACDESLERDESELFLAYLKTFEPFLSKEICQSLENAYEGMKEELKRNRKKKD